MRYYKILYDKINQKYGIIDDLNSIVIPSIYDKIYTVYEGYFAVKLNKKYGIIDVNNTIIVDFKYDLIDKFKNGISRVRLNDKYGIIDITGKELSNIEFDLCWYYTRNAIKVKKDKKFGVIKLSDIKNKSKYHIIYDTIGDYIHGYIKVSINKKYGFIDIDNNLIIEIKYDHIQDFDKFNRTKANIYDKNFSYKQFLLDNTGKILIDLSKTSFVSEFDANGFAFYYKYTNFVSYKGYFDFNGKIIIEEDYHISEVDKKFKVLSKTLIRMNKINKIS
jgi:hypothetical protein